jgi:hypothetical protein
MCTNYLCYSTYFVGPLSKCLLSLRGTDDCSCQKAGPEAHKIRKFGHAEKDQARENLGVPMPSI